MKKIFNIFAIVISIFLINNRVKAANATISVSGSNSAVVGNTITVNVTLSSPSSLGSWDFSVGYDTSKLRLTYSDAESTQRAVNAAQGAGQTSKTYTFKFKALSSGTAKIYINSSEVSARDDRSLMTVTKGSKSISLKTMQEIQASYSKNNYLSSLKVEGYELSTKFDKNTLEYSLELDSTVEKINVSASVEDKTASLVGAGEKELIEGENLIENSDGKWVTTQLDEEEKEELKEILKSAKMQAGGTAEAGDSEVGDAF